MADIAKMKMRPSLKNPGILLATWFGSGYIRPAPGTWGTLAAFPFAWVLTEFTGTVGLIAAALVTFAVGIWAANLFEALSQTHDSSEIVIDEAAGLFLTYALVSLFTPITIAVYVLGFLLFRVFDILKPFPIRQCDRHIPGGFGVMVDDILAAVYAGLGCILLNEIINLGRF